MPKKCLYSLLALAVSAACHAETYPRRLAHRSQISAA